MGYVKWSYDTLDKFCHDVFRKFGFDEDETEMFCLLRIYMGSRVMECSEW